MYIDLDTNISIPLKIIHDRPKMKTATRYKQQHLQTPKVTPEHFQIPKSYIDKSVILGTMKYFAFEYP